MTESITSGFACSMSWLTWARHMDGRCGDGLVDDHTLRGVKGASSDSKENEADEWAEEALIPSTLWEDSLVKERPIPMAVIDMAYELGGHPAIIADRVRFQRGNYRLLSQFVGSKQVRKQFEDVEAREAKSVTLRFVTWDVEHGSAAYFQTPNNRRLVVDLGAEKAGQNRFQPSRASVESVGCKAP